MDPASPEGEQLSPKTQDLLNFLLEALRSGEACLELDSDGRVQIKYKDEKLIRLSHVDKSKAPRIQEGKNSADIRNKVEVCLEIFRAVKENHAPPEEDRALSGVVIDPSKVGISSQGMYREGIEFDQLGEVLGNGSIAGDIVAVKDRKTGAEHAVKTIMISEFSEDEVRAWVALGESEYFPSLYLIRKVDKIGFHMEKIEHGVTLDEIIKDHMHNLRQEEPSLVKPFSLCIFHGLLSAVREMHGKNWTHQDLHSGNVMLTKDTMTLKVLDFGMAGKLKEGTNFNPCGIKKDILCAVRLFTVLYTGRNMGSHFTPEKKIKKEALEKLLKETTSLSDEDRKELLHLISMVILDPMQAGYGDTTPVLEQVECLIAGSKVKMAEILKRAAGVLFSDDYSNARDADLHAQQGDEVCDGPGGASQGMDMDQFDTDAAAADIPDVLLKELSITPPSGDRPEAPHAKEG